MKKITVGRSEVCDIVINDSNISRIHAEIILSDGRYTFRDVSSNGSTINGKSINNSEVSINSSSSILLAHSIPLYWSKIEAKLANENGYSTQKTTESYSNMNEPTVNININNQQPPKTWLMESILVTLFCCLPLGIAGIVNASKVESRFYAGDLNGAYSSSANAKKWVTISFWIGLVFGVIYLILELSTGEYY